VHKDELKGKAEQAKGKVKDKVGEWTDNPDLEAEGEAEQVGGKVRETGGTVQRKVDEAKDKLK